jgi:hypothetical protein
LVRWLRLFRSMTALIQVGVGSWTRGGTGAEAGQELCQSCPDGLASWAGSEAGAPGAGQELGLVGSFVGHVLRIRERSAFIPGSVLQRVESFSLSQSFHAHQSFRSWWCAPEGRELRSQSVVPCALCAREVRSCIFYARCHFGCYAGSFRHAGSVHHVGSLGCTENASFHPSHPQSGRKDAISGFLQRATPSGVSRISPTTLRIFGLKPQTLSFWESCTSI